MARQSVDNEESFLQQSVDVDDEEIDIELEDNYFDDAEPELTTETPTDTSNRSIKSLGMLTKRFIKFLQESPVGLVDINSVSQYFINER